MIIFLTVFSSFVFFQIFYNKKNILSEKSTTVKGIFASVAPSPGQLSNPIPTRALGQVSNSFRGLPQAPQAAGRRDLKGGPVLSPLPVLPPSASTGVS